MLRCQLGGNSKMTIEWQKFQQQDGSNFMAST